MEEQQNERRKTTKHYQCPDCGNYFKSTGYQKRIICPFCYEKRTGRKLGSDTTKAREALNAKRAAQKAKVNDESAAAQKALEQKQNENNEKKQSKLDSFLNMKIF